LMEGFEISFPAVQWMATGFLLVMAIVIPISAVVLQWLTTTQLFLGTMTVFTIGTHVCSCSPACPIIILWRLIQVAGTGLLLPIIFNLFLLIYPPHKRVKIMGLIGLVIMFSPAIGPTLSGIIVEYLGWRFLFITVIPFALFSIAFAYKYLINVS